jgi:hypothetical protein
MAERTALRLPATLVAGGLLLYVLALFPTSTIGVLLGNTNHHPAELSAIAAGGNWPAVAIAQFLASALVTAGFLALYSVLDTPAQRPLWPLWAKRFGAVAAAVSLALSGVVYALDGVVLKQAADAWAQAPAAEKAARLATAEGFLWLEWGIRSCSSVMSGLALVLFAAAIVGTVRLIQPIGYLMGVQGLATFVLGWQTGAAGFSVATSSTYYTNGILFLVWSVWLLVIAWQKPPAAPAASG